MQRLVVDAGYALGIEQGTLLAVWAGEPDAGQLGRAVEHMLELHRRYPAGVLMFNLIRSTAGMPSEGVRAHLRDYFERMRGKLSAAAVVVEHRGILQSLSRAVISTLVTITRKPFPLKTFGDRQQAAQWLAEQPGAPSAAVLEKALSELDAALAPRASVSARG